MTEADPLDSLSTTGFDLALQRRGAYLDVRFFWRLMEVLPLAEAGAGELREAEADVATMRALDDLTDSGQGEVAELRPFTLTTSNSTA